MSLFSAVKYNHIEAVKQYIADGNDVNVVGRNGETALLIASFLGFPEIVEILINAGANVNVGNKKQDTALMLAAMRGHNDIIELLINAGANVNAVNDGPMDCFKLRCGVGTYYCLRFIEKVWRIS